MTGKGSHTRHTDFESVYRSSMAACRQEGAAPPMEHVVHAHVGSNPTFSANEKISIHGGGYFFVFVRGVGIEAERARA
ncbi:MAG: hypothetical protein K0R19_2129 [Bacillota bacterium]|nr:hypothetical protein [Bacillota bacterium]